MDIKVLGTGCANCKNTIALIEQVAKDKGSMPFRVELDFTSDVS